jgi:hypothetical protein
VQTSTHSSTTLETLDRDIARAHKFVVVAMASALLFYLTWFWIVQRNPLAETSATWGTFGDFMGGLLNPVVAYAAFYWLTRSVRLQKEELSETREALAEASTAQMTQANHAYSSVRLTALNTLTSSIMAEVQLHRVHLQYLVGQIYPTARGGRLLDGTWVDNDTLFHMIAQINGWIESRMVQRNAFEVQIKEILAHYADAV